ncbi:Guanylate-binding protein 4 [Phytophthora citrophthora]|uniref:Guanylate-binding protein 4 n=1 Tax=Phytophthora citrophthora TaxID=4793 RepID=A0AAD9FZG2_9STRA|nr:Guanylate-binding protein 4 [Phytophthora citrophthora]
MSDLAQEFPEEPVPLITFSEDEDQLKVNDEAVELLRRIDGHVAVVAMAGLYRTGKSSMLNWLLDRQSGFRVGPTIERCTRGIWLWGQPQKHIMANGESVWVLMLDTEGMGGLEASQQYDARIFSLATLLCSKLIYNSQGSVDEKAISGLSFIANLAKHIKVSASGDGAGEDEDVMQFHSFFPSFLWVVRDFTLELVDEDGDPISSSDYLERALADQPRTPANMERNRIRAMMKDFFRDRDCVTLVRPVHDETKLQQVDAMPIEELRPEFQEQLSNVKQIVYGDSLQPKMLQGKPLNGSMFAGLLQAYVAAINSGGVPVITSAWEGVTASECRKAMSNAADTFKKSLAALDLPLDDEDLLEAIKDAEQQAVAQYRAAAIGDSAAKLEVDLRRRMDDEKAAVARNNAVQSKEMCDRLLQVLYAEQIQPKLASASDESGGFADMQQFSREWQGFRDAYLKKARGGAKLECLLTFSETKYAEAMRILLSRQEEGYEKKIRTLQGDVSKVKEELGSVGGREQIYKEQIEQMQVQSSQIMSEKARFEAEAEAQRERIANLESLLQDEAATKQHVEIERESAGLKLSSEAKKREEVDTELERMKAEYERVVQEKERQEMELNLLSEECQQLRKGQTCGCTIS